MFTDITERRRAEHELLRSNRFLRTLSRCNETLVHATAELPLLQDMCRVVVESGRFALAWVGYRVDDAGLKVMALVDDRGGDYLVDGAYLSGAGHCDPALRAATTGEIQVVQSVAADACLPWRERAAEHGLGSAIALPLRVSREIIGALFIGAAEGGGFGPEEVALLSELAGDLGYGIEGLRVRADREQFMERLRLSMESTIRALSSTVELRDPYTAGHQRRDAELSAAVARRQGWTDERVQVIYLVGMVHVIGKIGVPSEILSKPGRLAAAEMLVVRTHAEAGYDILKGVEFPWPIAQIVRQHHERLDGSGYPQGLAGDAILPEARILAVCDVVEAMTTHRPYRPGLGIEAALAEIEAGKDRLYDARVVEACVRAIREGDFHFE
jgi:HD-GYP domain-containing protein (c-di-GMP phosphodiesterase class II)